MVHRVSLSLPVRNGERFIDAALRSLLAQSFEDFELIITDNASSDATEQICREFAARDPRIRYVRNERNIGAAANFNLGFELASGQFFKWCAHDDFISQDFIEECVHALDENPTDVLAYGRQQGVDQEGRSIRWVSCEARALQDYTPARRFQMVYKVQGFDAAMFGLIRRAALLQTSLHRSYYGSDIALLAELALLGSFRSLPHVTFYNRDHVARSINIADKRARQVWHDPRFAARPIPENIALLRHLAEIASRQKHIAPLRKTLPALVAWALTPHQLARYTLELIGFASPPLQKHVRTKGLQALQVLRSTPRRSQQEL